MKDMEFYGTLGPSCGEEEVLYKMFEAGMTGMRLNLSHKPLAACSDWIHRMQSAAKRVMKAQLLVDLQGPELRVGEHEEPVVLKQDEEYDAAILKLPECIPSCLKKGSRFYWMMAGFWQR